MELWVKGSQVYINGIAPMNLFEWSPENADPIPVAAAASVGGQEIWTFQAIRTNALQELATHAFLQGTTFKVVRMDQTLGEIDLAEVLQNGFHFEGVRTTAQLNMDYEPMSGFVKPTLTLEAHLAGHVPETIEIALNGPNALLNRNTSSPLLGSLPVQFELHRQPTIVIAADSYNDTHLWSLDKHGAVTSEIFRPHAMDHLIAYADGFGGYSVESHIIPPLVPRARADRKHSQEMSLIQALKQGLAHETILVPPLKLWVDAAKRVDADVAKTFVELIAAWDASHCWTCPATPPFRNKLQQSSQLSIGLLRRTA